MITKYPKHFYEPIRIKIAVLQIEHEFRKLFPSLNSDDFGLIDKDVNDWFFGEKFELEPVHDFWNLFWGITRGLKLKSLAAWITAENVYWEKKKIPLKKVVITWNFPGLEFAGNCPYLVGKIIDQLKTKEYRNIRSMLLQDSKARSQKYAPRDQFPILVFHDQEGKTLGPFSGYYILDGNRRTIKSITEDKVEIEAFVGNFSDKKDFWPTEYWFKTGVLRDLVFLAMGYEKAKDKKAFDTVKKFYQLLLRDYSNVQITTLSRIFKGFEKSDKFLKEIISEDY